MFIVFINSQKMDYILVAEVIMVIMVLRCEDEESLAIAIISKAKLYYNHYISHFAVVTI